MMPKKNKNSVIKSIAPANRSEESRDRVVSLNNKPKEKKQLSVLSSTTQGVVSQKTAKRDHEDPSGGSVMNALTRPAAGEREPNPIIRPASAEYETKFRRGKRDSELLEGERWSVHQGHRLTYLGLFLFTFTLYFRPYELHPALSGLSSMALYVAVGTLLIYLPTQLASEGSVTILNTETKCILFLACWAVLTIPLSKSPNTAWGEFSDTFGKVVIIFIIMANVLRTRSRLMGLVFLGIGTAVMLSYQALVLYREGKFAVEGYRVDLDAGGMFGNPNDLALHLVIFTPIALSVGLGSKNSLIRWLCYASAGLMVAANLVTQSRAGFLGLLAFSLVLVWKFGRGQRFKMLVISAIVGLVVILLAPGDYGTRIISIFVPSLDPVGSSDQRKVLLEQSILVSLRNPGGIGIGNFPIVGSHNLVTHNAYTQISAELGWLAFFAYLVFLISPLRKLAAIDRQLLVRNDYSWIYYLSIGLQAGIIGYMVTSFFASVAYQWYVYYPVAFAICLRRIYSLENIHDDPEFTQVELART